MNKILLLKKIFTFALVLHTLLFTVAVCDGVGKVAPVTYAGCLQPALDAINIKIKKFESLKNGFVLTPEAFEIELKKANEDPRRELEHLTFGNIENEPEVYRFDNRSPEEIQAAGGFFPNPHKGQGGMIDHSKWKSMGTGTFVSFSNEQTPFVGEWLVELKAESPDLVFYHGRPNSKVLSGVDWEKMRLKHWYIKNPNEELPQFAIYKLYEYRAKNVPGVRVTGFSSTAESEVLTRGVSIADGIEFRGVLYKVPLKYRVKTDSQGREFFEMKKLSYSPISELRDLTESKAIKIEDYLEIGPWQLLKEGEKGN